MRTRAAMAIATLVACAGNRPAPPPPLSSSAPATAPMSPPAERWYSTWGDATEWFEVAAPTEDGCASAVDLLTDASVTCTRGKRPFPFPRVRVVLVTPVPLGDDMVDVRQLEPFASMPACEAERPGRQAREAMLLRAPHEMVVRDLQRSVDTQRLLERTACSRPDIARPEIAEECANSHQRRADAESKLAAALSSEPQAPPPLRCESR